MMEQLRTAMRTIHADRAWWHKTLTGGALWLTVVGWPIVEGYQLESMENSHRGFPTPLPRWYAFKDKAVVGVFALVIDFFFFIFPFLIGGVLFFCGALGASLSGNVALTGLVALVALGGMGLFMLLAWISGASIVGKQRYVTGGDMEHALSPGLIGELLRGVGRRIYLQARVQSLPLYLVAAAILFLAAWLGARSTLLGLSVGWIGLSALIYARLVTIQLYLGATKAVQRRLFDMRYNQTET